MNALLASLQPLVLPEQVTWRLAWALVHFVWQGAAIAVLLALTLWLGRVRRPSTRYGFGLIALAAMVACPVVTFSVVRPAPEVDAPPSTAIGAVEEDPAAPVFDPLPSKALATEGLADGEAPLETDSMPMSPDVAVAPVAAAARSGWLQVQPWIVSGWLLGVAALSLRLLLGWIGVRRLRRQVEPVPEWLAERVRRLARALRVTRPLIHLSHRVTEAIAVGFLRPMILLPVAWVTELPPDMIEAVLAHELAHIRRGDLWVNLVQRLVETLLFYHPAVWWLSRRLRIERELCCDELAVDATQNRLRYAETLEYVGRLSLPVARPTLALPVVGPRGFLLSRIRHLLTISPPERASRVWLAGLMALSVPLALWWSAASLWNEQARAEDQRPVTSADQSNEAQGNPPSAEQQDQKPDTEPVADSVERKAIERGIQFLKSRQRDEGTWHENGALVEGTTALTTVALLQAGMKVDDPVIQKALPAVRKVEPKMIYLVALQTMALCAVSPKEDAELIRRNVEWIENAQVKEGDATGGWSYMANPGGRADGSCSRFAILGLDAAKRAKFDVSAETWQRVATYWLKSQKENGCWSYVPDSSPTFTMSLAGVAGLATAHRHLPKDDQAAAREAAMRKPHEFIAKVIPSISSSWPFYTFHCLERAGHLTDTVRFGDVDWKSVVTMRLIDHQRHDGAWGQPSATENELIATSFALMFLTGLPEDRGDGKADGAAKPGNEVPTNGVKSQTVDDLLKEFVSVQYEWQQLDVARKIVALGDKSAIPKMRRYLVSAKRMERCNVGFVFVSLGDKEGLAILIKELENKQRQPSDGDQKNKGPDPVTQGRYYAAHLLGELKNKDAVPALIAATSDTSIDYAAAISLGHIGDSRAIPALRKMAQESPKRLWAGYGLAELGEADGFKILTDVAANDSDWSERRHAVESLGKLGDSKVVAALLKALKDEHANVKVSAARALGQIGDPSALPALTEALNDKQATEVHAPTTVEIEVRKAIEAIETKRKSAVRGSPEPAEQQAKPDPFCGSILRVDRATGIVVIDRGERNGLTLREKFDVYPKTTELDGFQPGRRIAQIEVTRILSAVSAEARIDQSNEAPGVGDLLYSSTWKPRPEPKPGQTGHGVVLSVRGRVMIDGPIPKVPPIKGPFFRGTMPRRNANGEMIQPPPTAIAGTNVEFPDDTLVISREGGIAYVAVYLKKAPKDWTPVPPPGEPVVIEAVKHRFTPHFSFIRAGQPLKLVNSMNDAVNFHSQPLRGTPQNQPVNAQNNLLMKSPYTQSESLPNQFVSDIQHWMKGYLLALDHPFAAITDADGRFEIRGLPSGVHHFTVWHERRGYLNKDLVVFVEDGGVTEVELKYTAEQLERRDVATVAAQRTGVSVLPEHSNLAVVKLVREFGEHFAKQRFAEAEIAAKQAKELDPMTPQLNRLRQIAAFARRKAKGDGIPPMRPPLTIEFVERLMRRGERLEANDREAAAKLVGRWKLKISERDVYEAEFKQADDGTLLLTGLPNGGVLTGRFARIGRRLELVEHSDTNFHDLIWHVKSDNRLTLIVDDDEVGGRYVGATLERIAAK